jgi:two-component system, NarL family, invasion response regulator UvrY
VSRLYLVDDHAMMRDGLRAVLEHGGHSVVGETDDPVIALAELRSLAPDIVLVDLNLGERSGFELLEQIQIRKLAIHSIVLTMYARPGHVAQALRSGASGYVLKGSPASDILAAVVQVAAGRRYLGPQVAELAADSLGAANTESSILASLSAREQQVVALVVRGRSSAAIAEALQLSPKTVESYRSRLMAKLGVTDLPALVRFAIRAGIIGVDET